MCVAVDTSHSHWQQTYLLNTYYYFRFIPARAFDLILFAIPLISLWPIIGTYRIFIHYTSDVCATVQAASANICKHHFGCVAIAFVHLRCRNRNRRAKKKSRSIFKCPLNVAIGNQSLDVFSPFYNRRSGFISARIRIQDALYAMEMITNWMLLLPFGRKSTNEIFESIMQNKCNWQMHNISNAKIIINGGEKKINIAIRSLSIWNMDDSFDALDCGVCWSGWHVSYLR